MRSLEALGRSGAFRTPGHAKSLADFLPGSPPRARRRSVMANAVPTFRTAAKPARTAARTETTGTVEKALDLLFFLHASGGARGVSEIGRALGVPKSSAHRLLASLG